MVPENLPPPVPENLPPRERAVTHARAPPPVRRTDLHGGVGQNSTRVAPTEILGVRRRAAVPQVEVTGHIAERAGEREYDSSARLTRATARVMGWP
jgi:hypothetical protein